jgi:membrane protein DedA with SNARE-associated domain
MFGPLTDWLRSSRTAVCLLGLWAALEAIVWFILPDYLLLIFAVIAPARGKQWFCSALAGSIIGAILMVGICLWQPEWVPSWLFSLPFTHSGMLDRITHLKAEYGVVAIAMQPFSGVPAKVWIYDAAIRVVEQPLLFLSLLTFGRACRMALVTSVGIWLGKHFPSQIRQYWFLLWAAYTALFLVGLWKTAA